MFLGFWDIGSIWLLCCWDDFLLDFRLILIDFLIENQQIVNKKSIKKPIDDQMAVGMDVGWLLGRFWEDFGCQVGAKILKKSILKLSRNELKN